MAHGRRIKYLCRPCHCSAPGTSRSAFLKALDDLIELVIKVHVGQLVVPTLEGRGGGEEERGLGGGQR